MKIVFCIAYIIFCIQYVNATSEVKEQILFDEKASLLQKSVLIDLDVSIKSISLTPERIIGSQSANIASEEKSPVTDNELSTPLHHLNDVNNDLVLTNKSLEFIPFPLLMSSSFGNKEEDEPKLVGVLEKTLSVSLLEESATDLVAPVIIDNHDEEDISSALEKMHIKPKKCNKRLFVGEGDFSYTVALLKKHALTYPELAKSIIATEFRLKESLQYAYPDTFLSHINYLESLNVQVLYGIDATQIDKRFEGQRIKRIHFNSPNDGSDYNKQTLPKIIADFFASASHLQKKGDRVYVMLPYLKQKEEYREIYLLGNNYGIYEASILSGYQLLKKRKFKEGNILRYEGYKHCETKIGVSAEDTTTYCREYVFEYMGTVTEELVKTIYENSPPRFKKFKDPKKKTLFVLPFLETDNESSTYEDTENEGNI